MLTNVIHVDLGEISALNLLGGVVDEDVCGTRVSAEHPAPRSKSGPTDVLERLQVLLDELLTIGILHEVSGKEQTLAAGLLDELLGELSAARGASRVSYAPFVERNTLSGTVVRKLTPPPPP